MGSVSKPEQDRALQTLGVWCQMELTGTEPPKAVLENLNFDSIEAMQIQLGNWKIPDWVTQRRSFGETAEASKPSPRERKARSGTGPRQELPPAADAIPLFKQALGVLNEWVDALKTRKEYMQDGRFVAQDESHAPIFWTRPQGMSDEDWKALCEKFGQNPGSDGFDLWDSALVEPAGATQSPQEPLAALIAVYLLADLPPEPLLEKLHFAREGVDTEELKRHINGVKEKKRGEDGKTKTQHIPGLKTKAAQVARLMRGGPLRPGPSTGELSPTEQNIVWYRQQRERDGVPDAAIFTELKEKRGLSKAEYQRLKKFRLDLP
jgi:hypothetical protein